MTRVRFRPLAKADLPLLADWLGRAHVAQWWGESADLTAITATYAPMIEGADPTEGFIGIHQGHPFAFLQRYLLADNPEWERAVAAGWNAGPPGGRGPAAAG
jgi:aminoglycoside 6'-N-acetyltransferase